MALAWTVVPTNFLRSKGRTMLTGRDVRGRKSHFVVVSINICVLRVSVHRLVWKCVLMSDVLLMCPSIHFVLLLIDLSIRVPSVNLCSSIGVSESPLIDRLGNAYYCLLSYWFFLHLFRPSVDKLIHLLTNRRILMSDILNRHGPSVNLCQ